MPFSALYQKPFHILICAEARVGIVIVGHIISAVHKGRGVMRIEPNRITAQVRYVVKFFDNAANIAYPVTVCIIKACGIYLIKTALSSHLCFI